jgi:hypothetical protein
LSGVLCDVDSPAWDSFLDSLEAERRPPARFSFWGDFDRNTAWMEPKENWVGATFYYDDSVRVSPDNMFDPAFSPGRGIVPPGVPIRVLNRPRQHVVGAGYENLFSSRLCDFLCALAPCRLGDVVHRGEALTSHKRLFPEQSLSVLAPEGFWEVPHALHGTRIVAGLGIWLGRRLNELVVCRNAEGIGHEGAEHPVIVSVDVARQVEAGFRRGFWPEPIVDVESPEGQRILHLFRRVEALRAAHSGRTEGP